MVTLRPDQTHEQVVKSINQTKQQLRADETQPLCTTESSLQSGNRGKASTSGRRE